MPVPATVAEFLEVVRKSGLLDPSALQTYLKPSHTAPTAPAMPRELADALVRNGLLTRFQAEQLLLGKWRNFILSSKYKVLDCLGAGGMGSVFLCEHLVMRRRVALKVLPIRRARNPDALERFRREARAIACLSHPNIVAAYDTDQDNALHFLVMEYIDGSSLDQVVRACGPLDPVRAAHYIRQAALGLQHAHEAGLVHRDVKPSNLLLDRAGTVKVLDLGLARFFRDERDDLTRNHGHGPLGTTDYMAPEQALNSHSVDARADVCSLGATFFFLLTGRSPFQERAVERPAGPADWRLQSVRAVRPDVPERLAAVVARMLAESPAERYQSAAEVAAALLPWVQTPVPPPAPEDLLRSNPGSRAADPTDEALGALTPLSGCATAPLAPVLPTDVRPGVTPGHVAALTARPEATSGPPARRPPGRRRWLGALVAGAAGVLIVGSVLGFLAYNAPHGRGRPTGPGTSGVTEAAPLRLLVPAYFYPAGEGLKQWDRLIDSAASAPVVAIVNPDSGPGKMADPNFVEVIERLRKAGVTVIGYVSTGHGNRLLAEAKADVDQWARLYPQIQGFFFDEQASGADRVEYYVNLREHARKAVHGALVVTNPGTLCDEEYLSRPAADVACLTEISKDFDAYRPPSWADHYPASRFAGLIRGTEAAEQMKKQIREMATNKVGYGYVTDGQGPNPWERLPHYWEAEVAAVQRLNERKAP